MNLLIAQLTHLQSRDLLVAAVAVGLGVNIIYAVMTNHRRCFDLNSVRMMEKHFGRRTTQFILCVIGSICVLMGAYLVGQTTLNRKSAVSGSESNFELTVAGVESSLP